MGRGGQHWAGWSRLWSLEGAPSPGDSRCPLVACSPGACEQPMGVWASPWAWGVPRVGFFLFGGIQAAHGTGTPDLGCLARGRGRGRSPAFSVLCSWGAGSVPLGLRAPGWLWARPPARAAPHVPAVPAPPGPGHPSACSTEPAGLRAVCRAIDLRLSSVSLGAGMASPGAPDVPDAPTRLVARLPAQVAQSPPAWSPLLCGVDTQGLRGAARCGSPPRPLRVAWARAEAGPAGAGRRQGHWPWARPGDAGILPSLDVLDCQVGLAP